VRVFLKRIVFKYKILIQKGEEMLNLTDSAIRRFKEFLTQENLSNQGMGIRIFASSGG